MTETGISLAELEATREVALRWLVQSEIRAKDGSYRSIYDSATRSYQNWYPGETCVVCTAGAVLALERAGHVDLALESAERICELAIEDGTRFRRAIRAGRGSRHVLAHYMATAILALVRVHERSQRSHLLAVAADAGDFLIDRLQRRDGSLALGLRTSGWGNLLRRHVLHRYLWQAHCIEAFLALAEATGEQRYHRAAACLGDWLVRCQRADGSFPMEVSTPLSRLAAAVHGRSLAEIVSPGSRVHPAVQSYAVRGLALLGRHAESELAAQWLSRQLGAHGLLHQFYFRDGSRSGEEDVMPTAHFGLVLLEHSELDIDRAVLPRMAEGMAYAQIRSGDPNANGALRGLPLHPEHGEQAYCWDTVFAVLFLQRLLEERGHPLPRPGFSKSGSLTGA